MKKINQDGFVSIVVTLIITVILALITIGFSRLMSREYNQATKNQFSSQAFYAAESGVNDTAYSLAARRDVNLEQNCGEVQNIIGDSEQESINVSIPCLNTSIITPDLRYDEIGTNQTNAQVFPLRGVGDRNPARVKISWKPFNDVSSISNYTLPMNGIFPSQSNWTAETGVLKVYILPYLNGMSREEISNAAAYAYLMPVNNNAGGVPQVKYADISGPSGFGSVIDASCNDSNAADPGCKVEFVLRGPAIGEGIPNSDTRIFMVITSLYRSNSVTINMSDFDGNAMQFEGVQAIVDSTGKTSESVRRIQVRLPLTPRSTYSASGILAMPDANTGQQGYGVCKDILARPGSVSGCGL